MKYKDCSEILKTDTSKKGQDGVYVIYPDTQREVYCDMSTDGGGWTVIQKREDGDVDFYKIWKEYQHGFGNASKNYWIGDSLTYHSGMKFTTKDQDNDESGIRNCATRYHGAWWHNNCYRSHLNGEYAYSPVADGKYPVWYHWKGYEALQKTLMMIRLKN